MSAPSALLLENSYSNDNYYWVLLLFALVTTVLLIIIFPLAMLWRRIFRPTVISYPWAMPMDQRSRDSDKKKTVIIAGSYNPPHKGHLAMLQYLSERYGQVIAVIGMNPNKKYDVTPAERARLTERMIKGCSDMKKDNVRVEVTSDYIWRLAAKEGVSILFRGIRSWEKDGKEERDLSILNTWGPMLIGWRWPIPTYYLEGKPEFNHISSTLIRNLVAAAARERRNTEEIASLVPKDIVQDVIDAYSR